MNTNHYKYRIATSEAGLAKGANFFIRGLPVPQTVIYTPYSEIVPQSQGGAKIQGYETVSVIWANLDARQADTIRFLLSRITTNSDGLDILWLTIPKGQGYNVWVDCYGAVQPVEWSPGQLSHGLIYPTVVLNLNNVTIENEPSGNS